MKKKILYILLSLSIIIFLLIVINLVDIINIKRKKEYENLESALKILNVEMNNSSFNIIQGNKIKIDYDKNNINVKINEEKIEINELNETASKVTITIPKNFSFNQLYIKSNNGNIELNNITSEFFVLDDNSGNVTINDINIFNKADISVNSSRMTIRDANIHNIDLFIDDGNLIYDGVLNGRSEIHTSKGLLELNLNEKMDNYRIEIKDKNKNIKVNNKIIDNKSYTKGKKVIIISGKGMLNINGDDSYEQKK